MDVTTAGTIWDATTGTADKIRAVSGKLVFYANGSDILSGSNVITPGTWQHWVFTFSGSTAKLYRDGAQIDSGIAVFPSLGASMRIGQTVTPDDRLNGYLDDFFFTDVTLSDADILAIYNAGKPVESRTGWPKPKPVKIVYNY